MSCIKDDICLDSADYIEIVTGHKLTKNLTLDEWENLECKDGFVKGYYSNYLWNYPLTEIEHIIDCEHSVVLVRFPNSEGSFDYRFCEIWED